MEEITMSRKELDRYSILRHVTLETDRRSAKSETKTKIS